MMFSIDNYFVSFSLLDDVMIVVMHRILFFLSICCMDVMDVIFRLWEKHSVPGYAELFPMMVSNAAHSESAVRSATAQALAAALQLHKSFMEKTLDSLLELYAEKNIVSFPV